MAMNIYVGNLTPTATDDDVTKLFSQFGRVSAVLIIMDRITGESRGFGFVEMSSADEAKRAVSALNGVVRDNRRLDVSLLWSDNHSHGRAGSALVADSRDNASNDGRTNGMVMGRPGKLPPELLEWARQEFTEEEILAGVREIRETGGLELKDFIGEIEDIVFSTDE